MKASSESGLCPTCMVRVIESWLSPASGGRDGRVDVDLVTLVLHQAPGALAGLGIEEPALHCVANVAVATRFGNGRREDETEQVIGGLLKDGVRLGLGEVEVSADLCNPSEVIPAVGVERA